MAASGIPFGFLTLAAVFAITMARAISDQGTSTLEACAQHNAAVTPAA
jgi:hypothetical protein